MASILDSTRNFALASLLFLFPTTASSLDVLKMSDKELKALPSEEVLKLPAIDVLVRTSSSGYKTPLERSAAIFMVELALYDLKYYLAIPRGEENPALTSAIREFQKNIGAAPTGVLLYKEFITLAEKWDLILPKQVNLPIGRYVTVITDYARATGTWVFENDSQASPIQTSEITCTKDSMECVSITADIGDDILSIFNDYYKITKWTADEIVAENDAPKCVSYTLTINFRKEQAHLFRRAKGLEYCGRIAEKPQILHLEDGFKVGRKYYKSEDQKALSAYNPEYSKYLKRFYDQTETRK